MQILIQHFFWGDTFATAAPGTSYSRLQSLQYWTWSHAFYSRWLEVVCEWIDPWWCNLADHESLPQTLKLGLIPNVPTQNYPVVWVNSSYTLSVWALNQEILVDKEWLVNLSPNRNKAHIRGLLAIVCCLPALLWSLYRIGFVGWTTKSCIERVLTGWKVGCP